MGIRIGFGIGPLSVSAPLVPRVKPRRRRPASRSSCACSPARPAARPVSRAAPYAPRGEILTAGEAARIQAKAAARARGETESAAGAWVLVLLALLALVALLVSCG